MDHAASGGISREFVLCRDGDQAIKLDNIDQKYSKLAITSQHETNLRLIPATGDIHRLMLLKNYGFDWRGESYTV